MKKRKLKKSLFKKCNGKKMNYENCRSSCNEMVYFIGFIGSLIYYIQNATSFWDGVLGLLKAIVWPAILVYKLLVFLGA
ncbi:MAG: hypothetical protein ABFQ65_00600 [Nanoarchaeota archaeon]